MNSEGNLKGGKELLDDTQAQYLNIFIRCVKCKMVHIIGLISTQGK